MSKKTAKYYCPDCSKPCNTYVPTKDQVTDVKGYWDSMAQCPHCKGMHFKIVYPSGVLTIRKPKGEGSKSGWIKTELKIGHPRWHFFEVKDLEMAEKYKSLCGQIRFYVMHDTETRHITDARNCQTCVKLLKKKEAA